MISALVGGKAMEPGAIRAVFFDAGDTLHRLSASRSSILAALLAEDGVSLRLAARVALETNEGRELDRIWDSCDLLYADEESGQRYLRAQYRALLERLGVDGGWERAGAIARGMTRGSWRSVFPEARATLITIHARLKTGIISNAGSYMRRVYQELGMLDLVDILITSGEVGVQKPDPAIFALALKRVGVQPHEAIHVGDNPATDVVGARAAGITPILLARSGAPPSVDGTPIITSLAELLPLLGVA